MSLTDQAIHAIGIDRDFYREQLDLMRRELAAAKQTILTQQDLILATDGLLDMLREENADLERDLAEAYQVVARMSAERRRIA